jgi:hypothetical protein
MRMVVCLHIPTTFWLGGRISSVGSVQGVDRDRQTAIHTAELLIPVRSYFETEITIQDISRQVKSKFR